MRDNETLKQTKVAPQLIQNLKIYAEQNKLLLKEIYETAITDLIRLRRDAQEAGRPMEYLVSPSHGKDLNMCIRQELAQRVERMANHDETNVRRFLYTAIFRFAERHHLLYDPTRGHDHDHEEREPRH